MHKFLTIVFAFSLQPAAQVRLWLQPADRDEAGCLRRLRRAGQQHLRVLAQPALLPGLLLCDAFAAAQGLHARQHEPGRGLRGGPGAAAQTGCRPRVKQQGRAGGRAQARVADCRREQRRHHARRASRTGLRGQRRSHQAGPDDGRQDHPGQLTTPPQVPAQELGSVRCRQAASAGSMWPLASPSRSPGGFLPEDRRGYVDRLERVLHQSGPDLRRGIGRSGGESVG